MKCILWAITVGSMMLWSVGTAIAANPDHTERLKRTNQCPLCDLSGADLQDVNLFGSNLVGANLRGANLSGANLGSANLTDADLTRATLIRAYLHKANLEATNFSEANLTGAYLREATFMGTTLTSATLQSVNLSRTNLAGISLKGVDLTDANLSYAMLTGVRPGTDITSPYAVNFGATLGRFLCEQTPTDTDFQQAREYGIDVAIADLSGSTLRGATLRGTVLTSGNMTGSDFTNADLTDACLNGGVLTNAILDGANLQGARLERAVLDGVRLDTARNANLTGAFRSDVEAKASPAQQDARRYLGSMNRAQQAYLLENSRFSSTLQDLGLGIPADTEYYSYRVFTYANRRGAVMNAAIPRNGGFKTYLGFVNTITTPAGEGVSITTICESVDAKPLLPKLPTSLPTTSAVPCPAGFTKL